MRLAQIKQMHGMAVAADSQIVHRETEESCICRIIQQQSCWYQKKRENINNNQQIDVCGSVSQQDKQNPLFSHAE